MPTLSVIIPTLNESVYLPKLLDALNHQTKHVDEIIVADAGSKDATVEVAKKLGANVILGGMPGAGRNAGARVAKSEVLLFLDADVLPPRNFIHDTLKEFVKSKYGVATCLMEPIEKKIDDHIIVEGANFYIQMMKSFSPRAPGFCIFVKKTIHDAIMGFDESLVMSEDHDYVKRAQAHGTFGIMTEPKIPVSMRRLEKEGLVQLAFKYLWTEMYALTGKPIQSIPFTYEFGTFEKDTNIDQNILTNISDLRNKLGKISNPVVHFGKTSVQKINSMLETDVSQVSLQHIRAILQLVNKDVLLEYIQTRISLISQHPSMRYGWKKLKSFPKECIRILTMPL